MGAFQRKTRKQDENGLWEYALKALTARGYSADEMRDKLRRRALTTGDVDKVILRLNESGFLDDKRFAENFASSRLENEGLGKARVLRDLRRKRIPAPVAESVVGEVFEGTDEIALVEAYLRRKFRRTSLPEYLSEPKHLAAAYRRLRYAGFSSDSSIRVLKRYSERAEQLEGTEETEL